MRSRWISVVFVSLLGRALVVTSIENMLSVLNVEQ